VGEAVPPKMAGKSAVTKANRQFQLWNNFKTRQGDANKSPQLERTY
jgi:hypothetical protein